MFKLNKDWQEKLNPVLNSTKYIELENFLKNEYSTKTIYPRQDDIFNALNLVKFEDVNVVIIGQDPYHNPNQAHGLAFSVEKDIKTPHSLQNIYKELKDDLGCYIPNNGNLTKWAKQGVLLLNSVLTVEENKPNSHKRKGWEIVTTEIIKQLNKRTDPIVFLLWGLNAKALSKHIDTEKHFILSASHPSPMSANKGGWFGCRHFSKTNEILLRNNKKAIDWQIENL